MIESVITEARRRGLPPIAVAVLDAGAHLKALQREDGVSFLRADIAQAKAWGALAMATDSSNIAERYGQGAIQQGFIDGLNAMTGGRIVPLPGGVLIVDDGQVIGAVGAAGGPSEDDEACVRSALIESGFSA